MAPQRRYATGPQDNPLQRPNYPVFDAAGNLYVSDSRNWGQEDGIIYKFRPGGQGEVWCAASPGFTNGMALGPDDTCLYVVESCPPLISRIAINIDGSAGERREVVVRLPETVPDGVAVDVEGKLYITCYVPDRIYVCRAGRHTGDSLRRLDALGAQHADERHDYRRGSVTTGHRQPGWVVNLLGRCRCCGDPPALSEALNGIVVVGQF